MPKKYPKDQKREALDLFSIYSDIHTVHQLSGIPIRTLYRWRSERDQRQERSMARKNIENDATVTQSPDIHRKSPDSRHNHDTNTDTVTQPRRKHSDSDAAAPQKAPPASDSESDVRGVPGRTYPYPLEDDEGSNDDYEDFRQLRSQLMEHAQQLVANLDPAADDISRRTLALARILDRILQLDDIIPRLNPEQVIRLEYVYDGSVHNVPPWWGASDSSHRRYGEERGEW